jgi:hypothetical protein
MARILNQSAAFTCQLARIRAAAHPGNQHHAPDDVQLAAALDV